MENLNGTILRVTTRYDNVYPYDVTVEKCNNGNFNNSDSFKLKGGYTITLFLELSHMLNFSYVLVPSVNGYDFSSATEAAIDLYAGSYSLYERRARIVDFTFSTGKSRVAAFINHEFESLMKDIILGPFQLNLWLGLLGFFVILSTAFTFVYTIEKQSRKDAQFHCLALILQKDCGVRVAKNSTKIITWIICLASIIIISTYTGNIVSIKSVSRYVINSLESLVNSDYVINMEYGYNNGSTVQVIAEAIKENPTISKFLKKSEESNFVFTNFRKAIREVDEKPVAYVIDEETGFSSVNLELGHFPCTWGRVPLAGIQYPWAMYMRKKSPYRTSLNSGLLRLEEVGVTAILRKRWIPQFVGCLVTSTDFTAVSISELRFAYIILFIGFICSILAALVERYILNKHK